MTRRLGKRFLTPVAPPALPSDPEIGVEGSIYYNTSIGALKVSDGTSWNTITSGGGGGSSQAVSIEVRDSEPSPYMGRIYFDSSENTIRAYNGHIWYDVAGPKELIDHDHYTDGYVRNADYGNYVEFNNLVSMDGGTAFTSYASKPNDDIIDGGNA